MINSFRRFIITYRIFGKAKKRDFHKQPVPNSCGVVFLFLFILLLFGLLSVESSVRAEVKAAGSLVLRADDCLEGLELIIAPPRARTGW